ncbi:MAG: hypothetical protein K5655_01200 [Lachnospiraceae bacterium]|nr:hypothetical protein [Lachnospiraceae bacterium]
MNEQDNEITISLGDMFAYMLHRWKLVLIVGIICTATIGGFLIYQQRKSIQNKYEDATYNEMVKDMTHEQLKTVDMFYTRYTTFQERITENQFYADHSLVMKVDPNNVGVLTKEYLVRSGYAGVISSFTDAALDLDDYEKMAKIIGDNLDARYVNELVSLGGSLSQDSYMIDTDKVGDVVNGSIGNAYTGILTFRATANTRSNCDEIAKIADDAIREHMEALKSAGIEIEVSELTTSYTEKYDTGIAELQRTQAERGSQLVTDYYDFENNAKTSLDDDEFKVFSYLIEKEQEVTEKMHYIRYLAIGAVVGFVVSVIFLAIVYLFASGFKTFDDVIRVTKEKELGVVVQKTKSKIFLGKLFHNWAQKIEFHGINRIPEEEAIAIVCDRIGSICKGKGMNKVFLVSDSQHSYSKNVLDKAIEKLKGIGIEAGFGCPSASLEALQNLRQAQAAVVAITIKNSLPNVVKDELAICAENNIPVVANFVVYPQK